MIFALSNLIFLIPVACVLAIMLSMTGSMIVRPRNDSVRVFVLIIIWQFVLLGAVGLLARSTWFSLFWILVMLVFMIQLYFWERSMARNILLVAIGTNVRSEMQLKKLVHYLRHEGRGYWQRLGNRFGRLWQTTGDWQLALIRSRMARPIRVRMALAQLASDANVPRFHQQLAQTVQEQTLISMWLGRLTAASLSILALLITGLTYEYVFGPGFKQLWNVFYEEELYVLAFHEPWSKIITWKLHIIAPVLVWSILIGLYYLKKFPWLARYRPVAWLCGSYYRALSLQALADELSTHPDASRACQVVAQAIPVRHWSYRLSRAARQLSEGMALTNALAKNRLLHARESSRLILCRDPQTLSWALRELSQSLLQRTLTRAHVAVQILTVLLTLYAGVMACLFAIAVYGGLSDMIMRLT